MGTPEAVANADPALGAAAAAATPMVAASTITTALLTPVLTSLVVRLNRKKAEGASDKSDESDRSDGTGKPADER